MFDKDDFVSILNTKEFPPLGHMSTVRVKKNIDDVNLTPSKGKAYYYPRERRYPLVPYPHTYIALYSRSPKLPVTHTKTRNCCPSLLSSFPC